MAPDPDEGVGPRLSASGRGEVTAFVLGGGGLLGAAEVGGRARIVVEDSGRALFVTGTMDGAPPIDVLFLRKDEAETSIGYYTTYAQIGPLGGQPFYGEVMQTGAPYSRSRARPPSG